MDNYIIPDDIELKDGHGRPTFRIFTRYRRGDKVTLNYKQIELISKRVKSGEVHPFEEAPFCRKSEIETPGSEMLKRFNNGEIATVTGVVRQENVMFVFDDGFECCQNEKWLKKLKKMK